MPDEPSMIQLPIPPSFESQMAGAMFSRQQERTFIDKIVARQDVEALRELTKKNNMTRAEILETLYLLTSVESKLLNYSEWDRYVQLKFFVWIREFIKCVELLFDYTDDLKLKAADPNRHFKLTPRTQQLLDNCRRMLEHDVKFLVDLYLNIGRTTLSLGATGFDWLLKNKYEVVYPNQSIPNPGPESKPGLFGIKMR
jgi:hypothetical protein